MTPHRDIDALLDAWLDEGPLEAPERILDVVADRVHRRRPEPAWRLAWRDSRMNTVMKPILAAAAIIVISTVGVAVILNQPSPDTGGPAATPTQVASPSPSPSPSPSAATLCQVTDPSCRGPLAAGVHTTDVVITPFTFEVPEGWSKPLEEAGVVNLERVGGWAGFVGVWPDMVVASQTLCSRAAEPSVGRSAEELVTWLAEHPGLSVTEPVRVELGGLIGWMLEAEMRTGWDPVPCPGQVNLFSHDGTEIEDAGWWNIGPDRRMRLTVLEAGDHTVMIDIEADKTDFATVIEEATPVVESFQFTQP